MQRLIGLVPPELSERPAITFEEVRGQVEPLLGIKVRDVNWFSAYCVHHRVADRFRILIRQRLQQRGIDKEKIAHSRQFPEQAQIQQHTQIQNLLTVAVRNADRAEEAPTLRQPATILVSLLNRACL